MLPFNATLLTILETYNESPDRDAVRTVAYQAFKLGLREFLKEFGNQAKELDECLKELRARLSGREGDDADVDAIAMETDDA
jgi:hypothetical protein